MRLTAAGFAFVGTLMFAVSPARGDESQTRGGEDVEIRVVAPKRVVARLLTPADAGSQHELSRCVGSCVVTVPSGGIMVRVQDEAGDLIGDFPVGVAGPSVLEVDPGNPWMKGVGFGLIAAGALAFLYGSGSVVDATMSTMGEQKDHPNRTLGYLAFGGGALGVLTGIAMYGSGSADVSVVPRSDRSVTLAPSPHGGFVTFHATF